tara:strand:+ start:1735 stop:2019 length:285 start_codon:yes stop_codon:yes gene_type:complete
MNTWTPKPGEMVQIWDHLQGGDDTLGLSFHGEIGYIVGESKDPKARSAGAYRVICFGHNTDPTVGTIIDVNMEWLHQVKNTSDIKYTNKMLKTE